MVADLIHVFGLDQHEILLHNQKLSRLDYGNQYVASNNAVQFYKIIGKFSNLITKLRVKKFFNPFCFACTLGLLPCLCSSWILFVLHVPWVKTLQVLKNSLIEGYEILVLKKDITRLCLTILGMKCSYYSFPFSTDFRTKSFLQFLASPLLLITSISILL